MLVFGCVDKTVDYVIVSSWLTFVHVVKVPNIFSIGVMFYF